MLQCTGRWVEVNEQKHLKKMAFLWFVIIGRLISSFNVVRQLLFTVTAGSLHTPFLQRRHGKIYQIRPLCRCAEFFCPTTSTVRFRGLVVKTKHFPVLETHSEPRTLNVCACSLQRLNKFSYEKSRWKIHSSTRFWLKIMTAADAEAACESTFIALNSSAKWITAVSMRHWRRCGHECVCRTKQRPYMSYCVSSKQTVGSCVYYARSVS